MGGKHFEVLNMDELFRPEPGHRTREVVALPVGEWDASRLVAAPVLSSR